MDPNKVSEILEMFDAKMTVASIAEEVGLSEGTIRILLKAQGRELVRSILHPDEQKIIDEYSEDVPANVIINKYNLTYTRLYAILARNDIPVRVVASKGVRDTRMELALDMYQADVPLWKIKQETGIGQPALHTEIHNRDIPLRRPRKNKEH